MQLERMAASVHRRTKYVSQVGRSRCSEGRASVCRCACRSSTWAKVLAMRKWQRWRRPVSVWPADGSDADTVAPLWLMSDMLAMSVDTLVSASSVSGGTPYRMASSYETNDSSDMGACPPTCARMHARCHRCMSGASTPISRKNGRFSNRSIRGAVSRSRVTNRVRQCAVTWCSMASGEAKSVGPSSPLSVMRWNPCCVSRYSATAVLPAHARPTMATSIKRAVPTGGEEAMYAASTGPRRGR